MGDEEEFHGLNMPWYSLYATNYGRSDWDTMGILNVSTLGMALMIELENSGYLYPHLEKFTRVKSVSNLLCVSALLHAIAIIIKIFAYALAFNVNIPNGIWAILYPAQLVLFVIAVCLRYQETFEQKKSWYNVHWTLIVPVSIVTFVTTLPNTFLLENTADTSRIIFTIALYLTYFFIFCMSAALSFHIATRKHPAESVMSKAIIVLKHPSTFFLFGELIFLGIFLTLFALGPNSDFYPIGCVGTNLIAPVFRRCFMLLCKMQVSNKQGVNPYSQVTAFSPTTSYTSSQDKKKQNKVQDTIQGTSMYQTQTVTGGLTSI